MCLAIYAISIQTERLKSRKYNQPPSLLGPNICYLLDLATTLLPPNLDQTLCQKTAVLITAVFSKNSTETENPQSKCHFEYVCLKLCIHLLELANNQDDNRGMYQLFLLSRVALVSESWRSDMAWDCCPRQAYNLTCRLTTAINSSSGPIYNNGRTERSKSNVR